MMLTLMRVSTSPASIMIDCVCRNYNAWTLLVLNQLDEAEAADERNGIRERHQQRVEQLQQSQRARARQAATTRGRGSRPRNSQIARTPLIAPLRRTIE